MQIFDHWYILLILLVIILIIWGPGKLPDVGAGLGRAFREFRKASSETQDAFKNATTGDPAPAAPAQQQPTPQTPATPGALGAPDGAGQPVSDPTQQTPVSR
ncbi:MAG: twin-arginine translocase TatA/TatE family subunit [Candidatus Dormibacteraeota bacterium]|nr:twin-arginine translocase TatA/TatE family subunit [Candidatus Dormibacteraeota bacterium]